MMVFYVPIGNGEDARALARTLLREHLVACANFIPIRSLYHWEGELHEEARR